MGVRLYPITERPEILEKLAGVPRGTYAKLKALRNQFDKRDSSIARSEDYYEALWAPGREHQQRLNDFIVFGWGKFHHDENSKGYCGRLTDIGKAQAVLMLNDICYPGGGIVDAAECEGVCWS